VTLAKKQLTMNLLLGGVTALGAYGAMTMVVRHARGSSPESLLVPAGIVALAALLFWSRRQLRQGIAAMASQLGSMAASRETGRVTAEHPVLRRLVCPLNELLLTGRNDVAEQRAANRELQIQARLADAEKDRLQAIIHSINDAVIVVNRFDELMLANAAAERVLGFKLGGAMRKNIEQILTDAALVRMIREARAHAPTGRTKTAEHAIEVDGERRVFLVTLSCVATDQDRMAGVVAVLQDVTKEKEIAQMKTDFVSNVSHELRSPLAGIKAYIEMLLSDEVDSDQTRREFYEIISGETDRLSRLIDNILNISRIESGVIKVSKEPVSLTAVVKETLEVATPQAANKNIDLVTQTVPVFNQVEADRDMLSQAVMNLVSNAVKYTTEGGTITVSTTVDEGRQVAACEVADTGVGIAAEDLPHICDKFYRVRTHSQMAKGTGLGLSLVKHIVETVHSGRLDVSSKVGQGSTFRMELPLC